MISSHHCVFSSLLQHYGDVIMGAIASQITSLAVVYSAVYSDADQRKHQSSASLAFVRGIHRRPVNSPHKWPVTRKIFPFDDVITNFTKVACIYWRMINPLSPGRYSYTIKIIIFKFKSVPQDLIDDFPTLDNSSVPSGNKQCVEPMMTKYYNAIRLHYPPTTC